MGRCGSSQLATLTTTVFEKSYRFINQIMIRSESLKKSHRKPEALSHNFILGKNYRTWPLEETESRSCETDQIFEFKFHRPSPTLSE